MEEIQIPTKIYSGTDSLDWLQDIHNRKILMVCDAFLPNTPTLKHICDELDYYYPIHLKYFLTLAYWSETHPKPLQLCACVCPVANLGY